MMNQKTIALLIVALMAVSAGILLKDEQTPDRVDEWLLPGFKERLDAVQALQIRSLADSTTVTVARRQDTWVVEEKGGYPADFEKVSAFLNLLAELKIAESKTARVENHGILGLADTGADAGTLVVVSPLDIALIIGKQGKARGSFVRRQDDAQVYLTDKVVMTSPDVLSWVDPVVINLDSTEVSEISIATRQAGYLRAGRDPKSGDLVVYDLPEDRALKYESVVDGLGRTLVNLRLLDVMPFDTDMFKDPSILRVTTNTGEVISVASMAVDGKYFAHIDTQQRKQWQYEISEYNYAELNKTMEDLLAPQVDNNE